MSNVSADGVAAGASEHRARLVRNKSSSSSLSLMNDSRENLGDMMRIDCCTWGNRGLRSAKFGQSSQLLFRACDFPVFSVLSLYLSCVFKPPPPVGAGGGLKICFRVVRPCVRPSVRPCVRPSVRPSVRDSRGSFMFPRYLQYLLTDFRQTFVTGASWDTDDLITFLGQRSRSHHRGGGARHSMLPSSATFSSFLLVLSSWNHVDIS